MGYLTLFLKYRSQLELYHVDDIKDWVENIDDVQSKLRFAIELKNRIKKELDVVYPSIDAKDMSYARAKRPLAYLKELISDLQEALILEGHTMSAGDQAPITSSMVNKAPVEEHHAEDLIIWNGTWKEFAESWIEQKKKGFIDELPNPILLTRLFQGLNIKTIKQYFKPATDKLTYEDTHSDLYANGYQPKFDGIKYAKKKNTKE